MRAGRRFHFERQQRDRATLRQRSLFPPFANCAKDGAPHIVWNCQRDKKDWATRRCCIHYRIGYDATWINKFAPAFPTPALRKLREERGTRFVGAVKETKGRATRHPTSFGTARRDKKDWATRQAWEK